MNKATVGVGALLLLLILNLAFGNPLFNLFFGGAVSAGTRPTPPPTAARNKEKTGKTSPQGASRSATASTTRVKDEFASYDPSLNLDELKDLVSRSAPKLDRNPFELPSPPPPPEVKASPALPPTPPPPPPPPPIMLKVVGLSEKPGGGPEAYICESSADGKCREDVEVYVVHEGDQFGKHYKVVKIVPTQVDVVDETTQQSAQLLVPQ